MFIRLALANLIKHRRRTALILFAVLVSVLVMEVMAGMVEGIRVNFFRTLTQESGHVQITAPGRHERLNPFSLDYTVAGYAEIIETLQESFQVETEPAAVIQGARVRQVKTPAAGARNGVRNSDGSKVTIAAVEELLHFGALLQYEERNVTLAGIGARPETRFYHNVREGLTAGTFLRGLPGEDKFRNASASESPSAPPSESPSAPEANHSGPGVLVSDALADLLGFGLGDPVQVVVEDSTGSPYYMEYKVSGLFETASPDFDENTFFITHENAQELLYLEGETIEIRLLLGSQEQAEAFKHQASPLFPKLEIQTWKELQSGMISILEMLDFFLIFMNLFVVIVAASVITNAILMNVFERTREFGTMRAIGMKKRQVGRVIFTEGLVQGVVGSLLGLALGIPIVLYFTVNGLDWGGISEAFGMGSSYFYFGYSPRNSALSWLGGVLIALGGSLYAAWAGTRLSIMETLRYE